MILINKKRAQKYKIKGEEYSGHILQIMENYIIRENSN